MDWRRIVLGASAAGLMTLAACSNDQQAANDADSTPGYGAIDRARLLDVDSEPDQWLTTGRDFGKTHYSPLDQINRDNVGKVGLAWEYETFTKDGLEASPIVVDGVMYTSGVEGRVYALNAKTGDEFLFFDPVVDGQANRPACCGPVNRGVAVYDGLVYVAALDGMLYALDAQTGDLQWQADTVVDHARGYTSTGGVEVAGDKVVIGNGGGDMDARGYVSAYDRKTGDFAWRFFIVPGDPAKPYEHPELEMAAQTWDPNSRWDVGLGGTPWDALVYDPELNLLYVGTGNAALYNSEDRSPAGGDNLFLTSILAINPDSGRLAWYYQEVPGDEWDFTATAPIVLADLEIDGRLRKVLMQAPKNGFFYVLDRETGEFISAKNFAPVNWGAVDPKTGKATVFKDVVDYGYQKPRLIFPSAGGAHSWHPMAYSPKTGLVYLPTVNSGNYLVDLKPGHDYHPGLRNNGIAYLMPDGGMGGLGELPPEARELVASGALLKEGFSLGRSSSLQAWDPVAQKAVWSVDTSTRCNRAGMLATAGGIVVQGGADGLLCIFNDETGELLRSVQTGSSIVAAPVTYIIDGEQYIALMAGVGLPTISSPGPDTAAYRYGIEGRILAFKLTDGSVPTPPLLPTEVEPIPKPPMQTADADTIARGHYLFDSNCNICHSNGNNRGSIPDLRRMTAATHAEFNAILLEGARRDRGMPQWDDIFSKADVEALHAWLIDLAWQGYRAEQAGKDGTAAAEREHP